MLELKTVAWQNFMSYGDYETVLNLDELGQCLITGEVVDGDKSLYDNSANLQITKSNGAGKSTVVNAIQWVLFGRTMHSSSPGDKIVNYFTGKDCVARLEFTNGDFITRTRKSGGHNELHFVKDGNEITLTSETLSTQKNQQKQLNREFNLDWEVFCGSIFFNQYGKPWMEMADSTRKKAIERVLHVDRFAYYAKNAKGKCGQLDSSIDTKRGQINTLNQNIVRLNQEIERLTAASENYGKDRDRRVTESLQTAIDEKKRRDAIERPNLEKLQAKWDVVKKVEEYVGSLRTKLNVTTRLIATIEGTVESLSKKIKTWGAKAGKICNACEQEVPTAHTASKIDPIKKLLVEEKTKLAKHQEDLTKTHQTIKLAEGQLADKKPKTTIRAAKDTHSSWERHDKAMARFKADAAKIQKEKNPHTVTIAETKKSVEEHGEDITKLEKDIEQETFLNRHYAYIYKAYNDRTKIKSFVFQEHVPFINSRLRHYLDVFGLDVQIELTPALGITSNLWGYEFESGGERKRTDVAFMLAMFDFHEQMYGRQCNMLVLDEVDGRLDDDGIDSLVNIIKNDLAPKVKTILIISHRNLMYDTFPKELRVTRTNRFSQITEVV